MPKCATAGGSGTPGDTTGGPDGIVFGAGSGTLVFNHTATDYVFTPALSGAGTIRAVAGTTRLTGDGAGFTGTATVASGASLQVGGSFSFGGAIVNNGTSASDYSGDLSYANSLSGSGTLNKTGSGTLELTGSSPSFTGATILDGGGLEINGSLAGSQVTARSGTVLSGSGTVGGVVAQDGSTVAPGRSPGTLTVTGNYAQQSGAVYSVELVPGSTVSDRIDVQGSATIAPGALLSVSRYGAGDLVPGTRYTILTVGGGVTGTYRLSGDTRSSVFFNVRDAYDANNVYPDIVQARSFAEVARTDNQRNVASALDGARQAGDLSDAVMRLPDEAAARSAFDALSGDIHPTLAALRLANGLSVREAALGRLRAASGGANVRETACLGARTPPERDCPTMWMQGAGSRGRVGGDDNAQSLRYETGGVLIGLDAPLSDNVALGMVAGSARSRFQGATESAGTMEGLSLGVYAGGQWAGFGLRLGASQSWDRIETNRSVTFPGYSDALSGRYRGSTTQVFGEAGDRLDLGGQSRIDAAIEPFIGLAGVDVRQGRVSERGGDAALTSPGDDAFTAYSSAGLHATAGLSVLVLDIDGTGTIGWRHAIGGDTPETRVKFSGGDEFAVSGVPVDRDTVFGGIGLSMAMSDDVILSLTYAGEKGKGDSSQSVLGTVRWAFWI